MFLESADLWKNTIGLSFVLQLPCTQSGSPDIWLKQEGIYILNMPRTWHQNCVNAASGNSDPLTDEQIDFLHMALNRSVGVVNFNMHFLCRFCKCAIRRLEKTLSMCHNWSGNLPVSHLCFLLSVLPTLILSYFCFCRDRKDTPVHLDFLEKQYVFSAVYAFLNSCSCYFTYMLLTLDWQSFLFTYIMR